MSDEAAALKKWFEFQARPFLKDWSPDRVEALNQELERMDRLQDAARRRFQACFLGNSGVGKSTLINILVNDTRAILPQGGVGPLTALATKVQWSENPYFEVTYHKGNRLNRLRFALERQIGANESAAEAALDEEDRAEVEILERAPDGDENEEARRTIDAYKRQAQLLICGSQFQQASADIHYLTSGLRKALGLELRFPFDPAPADAARIERLSGVLQVAKAGKPVRRTMKEGGEASFSTALEEHAAGFLAPLVREISVGLSAPLLRDGLTLVDLPGVGIANDEYRSVTIEEIRRAKAIVLVVDRSGVTEAGAILLRDYGFLNSLLHDDAESEPTYLFVVAVKLDLSADDAKLKDFSAAEGTKRRWVEYFDDVCERAVEVIRGQMHEELQKIVAAGAQDTRTRKEETLQRMLSSLRVFPVSSLEHRKFHLGDEDAPARIRRPEQSRIPSLRSALTEAAVERNALVDSRLSDQVLSLRNRTCAAVEVICEQWAADRRSEEEAEALRKDLNEFLEPRKKELRAIRAQYREFLRETMKTEIARAVLEAAAGARKEIRRKLRRYEEYHWGTLRAAISRGGHFDGARLVNLPLECALAFEEFVTLEWREAILGPLRNRTRKLGSVYVEMVTEVVAWAAGQGARVNVKLVEALAAEIREEVKQFATVGREFVDELRDSVKEELLTGVRKQIESRCRRFMNDQERSRGGGVKERMLRFFAEDLTDAVIESASITAGQVFLRNYEIVAAEVLKEVGKHEDPLKEAAEQIVATHEENQRRVDRRQAKIVIDAATALIEACPVSAEA